MAGAARLTLRLLADLRRQARRRGARRRLRLGRHARCPRKAGYEATGLDQSRLRLEQLDRPDRSLIEADLNQPIPEGVSPV